MSIIITCFISAIIVLAAMIVTGYYTLASAINRLIDASNKTDKQVKLLRNSLRKAAVREKRRIAIHQRFQVRVKKLETQIGEKTNETSIRNTRTSSYDAGAR